MPFSQLSARNGTGGLRIGSGRRPIPGRHPAAKASQFPALFEQRLMPLMLLAQRRRTDEPSAVRGNLNFPFLRHKRPSIGLTEEG